MKNVPMKNISQIVALNAGKETISALSEGTTLSVKGIKTRELAIEIDGREVKIFNTDEELNFDDSLVFNRFPTNSHFCGILLEYLNHKGVEILNKQSQLVGIDF